MSRMKDRMSDNQLIKSFWCQTQEKIALDYNIGVNRDDDNESSGLFYTIAPGFDLGEKWYAYIEAFGSFRTINQNIILMVVLHFLLQRIPR